jgi:hypothetical protein
MSEGDASVTTGYSPGRISVLKADPQFQDLLAFYRGHASDAVADFRGRMADMGMDALAELRDRMEADPDSFTPSLLNEIIKTMADRTGHAPQRGPTAQVQVNVNLADRMTKARERVNALRPVGEARQSADPGIGPGPTPRPLVSADQASEAYRLIEGVAERG